MAGYTAGMLRHRGTFQKAENTTNSQGQVTTDWANVAARVPVKVGGDGKQEVLRAFSQQVQSDVLYQVTLRWRNDIDNGMRFVWHDEIGDRTMSITSRPIDPDGKKNWMILVCKEPL